MTISDANWPKHPDGTRMTLGEMTKEQQAEIVKSAGEKLQQHFDQPEIKAAMIEALGQHGPRPGPKDDPKQRRYVYSEAFSISAAYNELLVRAEHCFEMYDKGYGCRGHLIRIEFAPEEEGFWAHTESYVCGDRDYHQYLVRFEVLEMPDEAIVKFGKICAERDHQAELDAAVRKKAADAEAEEARKKQRAIDKERRDREEYERLAKKFGVQ